jgi:membrane-bound lytic murein transglycosylase D
VKVLRFLPVFLVAGLCLLPDPVFAQQTGSENGRQQDASSGLLAPMPVRPLDRLLSRTDSITATASADTLTQAQFLSKLARIYGYQADLMAATALGPDEDVVPILENALTELADIMRFDYIRDEPRFLEVYQVLLSEYERHFGVSDTLFVTFGDIFDIRNEVFSELETVRNPLLEHVLRPDLQPLTTTVPMTTNRLVESTMETLLKTPERHLNHWLKRADTYFPMIEEIFQEEGVPDELKYLAMIESGLNPVARSWARAVGMWQFVAATGRAYGLEINAWVDERMDPEKSTRAAARHLKDLHERYGDWQIALAGYNCSPRCIQRAIRRAKSNGHAEPTYWDMYRYLPRETRGYIPMFIATAFITSNPGAFGLEQPEPGPAYEYQMVAVQGMLSLQDVADMAGTDLATIKALNPNLRRSALPPSTGSFYLRIPAGSAERFMAAYDALPDAEKQPSGEYIVRSGDTLSGIGNQFGVSVSSLMQKNGLRSTRIQIGQRLVVPMGDYSGSLPDGVLADASGSLVQYGPRSRRPIIAAVTPQPASSTTPIVRASAPASGPSEQTSTQNTEGKTRVAYTIRRGDTLGRIATRYGVRVSDIQAWNNLRGSRINEGAVLSIYLDPSTAETSSGEPITYVVRSGDTLSEIARQHSVTITQLRQWNGISGSRIRVGQRLEIRPNNPSDVVTHTVQSGETLIGIAGRYATTVARIKSWNNLTSNTIRVGQQLTIFR